MNCKSYSELTIIEKIEFIGKLHHLVQTDEESFKSAKLMVDQAEYMGTFLGVQVGYNNETIEQDSLRYINLSS